MLWRLYLYLGCIGDGVLRVYLYYAALLGGTSEKYSLRQICFFREITYL
jgi:hypothetical protein